MFTKKFQIGAPVVFCVRKHTAHPGPRAKEVHPEPNGELYSYVVDKFWTVAAVQDDGKLLLVTRRGKEHLVSPDDPQLRHPSLWEMLFQRRRFPKL